MLPYDQIPQDRRTIAGASGRLGEHGGVLAVALAQWMARDDSNADPGARRAANTAMGAVDAMLAELHQLRSRLVGEIRVSDDAAAARADELLAQLRDSRRKDTRAAAAVTAAPAGPDVCELRVPGLGLPPADPDAWVYR